MTINTDVDALQMIEEHRRYFYSGSTRSCAFRLEQLAKLRSAIIHYEKELSEALYKDLRKSETEAYASEIGLVLNSISAVSKQLKKWMKPTKVKTPIQLFGTKSYIKAEPYGTVLIVSPFNYPVQLVFEPLIGAIAAGNCAVVKPSEHTPFVTAAISKLIKETFNSSYIRVVEGEKETTSSLINAPFDYIFFTGSVSVGKIVMEAAAKNLVPVTLELGGKSPVIVDRGANLELAAKRIVWGKFLNAGQTCIAPDYMLVHEDLKLPLITKLRETIYAFFGENVQNSSDYGRIINERQFDRLADMLKSDNERVCHGGGQDRSDLYLEPTLLDVGMVDDRGMDVASMADEIFGPILPILTYSHIDEAIEMIRQRPKPLALYLFTEDRAIESLVMDTLSFGGGCVNDTLSHIINHHLPFGGVGTSGIGGYHGKHSFDLFSHQKSVLKRSTRFEIGIMFPPYKNKLKLIRKVLK
ncbi:aldehyde dehydrogenase [Paenibacillus sp. GSMTC-2017]|uniref:aldehyde dehydrogenase n=1 Tax=Paenibacillus sp. GSMTC-2017 TaxID=2794350 RepID=UPI0018D7F5F5|nr:aldehyde dehydrogenase [Paenibacillus sp. GSMTC-2017]MBH5318905.1 aldehyde dehydrogenase [Paenibacillus sp. GSMTC-2017]